MRGEGGKAEKKGKRAKRDGEVKGRDTAAPGRLPRKGEGWIGPGGKGQRGGGFGEAHYSNIEATYSPSVTHTYTRRREERGNRAGMHARKITAARRGEQAGEGGRVLIELRFN